MDQIIEQYFDFGVMFDPDNFDKVLEGFWFTIKLSIVAGILSLIWGLILAVLRQTPGKLGRDHPLADDRLHRHLPRRPGAAHDPDRLGSLGALSAADLETGETGPLPRWIGVPDWFGQPSPFWYGVIALTLTYGAYMAEVYRAGIEAVPNGQMEAARSLGMSHGQAMRKVIVPQAVRKVIPPLLNDFIALMKDTTLVSVIGLIEVVQAGRDIQSETFNSSALMLGAILFVLVTIPLARLVDVPDRAGSRRSSSEGWHERPERRRSEAPPTTAPMLELRRRHTRASATSRVLDGVDLDRRARRGRLRARAERLRQEHAAALHQPALAARRAAGSCSRARRSPARGTRRASTSSAAGSGWSSSSSTCSRTRTALENVTLAPETVLGRPERECRSDAARSCSRGSG